jgi:nicotinamidase-related amidase
MNTKALLVVDVQEEYIGRYEDGLLKRIIFKNELVNFIKENGITNIEIVGVDGSFCVSSTAKEGKKIFRNVTVNCDCVGALNCQRFEKTKETLNKLGVEIRKGGKTNDEKQ